MRFTNCLTHVLKKWNASSRIRIATVFEIAKTVINAEAYTTAKSLFVEIPRAALLDGYAYRGLDVPDAVVADVMSELINLRKSVTHFPTACAFPDIFFAILALGLYFLIERCCNTACLVFVCTTYRHCLTSSMCIGGKADS